jgi:aspartokinase
MLFQKRILFKFLKKIKIQSSFTGFIQIQNQETTTLGRNGSTASLIANYINAEELQNSTLTEFNCKPRVGIDAKN